MSIAPILTALSNWNAARSTHRALARFTNRELADLGLNRGDIEVEALLANR